MATLVVFVCLAASLSVVSPSGMNTTLTYSGDYQININNKPWFFSAQPYVVSGGVRYGNNAFASHGQIPAVDQPLLLKNALLDQDHDALGDFRRMRYQYFAGLKRVDMDIRAYDDMVVFSQAFPGGLINAQIPDTRKTLTGFPALQWSSVFNSYTADGYLTFSGELRGDASVSIGKWPPLELDTVPPDGVSASGPLCIFNSTGRDAVVISPLTQAMAVSPWHHQWKFKIPFPITDAQTYWGLDRELAHVPAGFKVEVIMVYSPDGIGKALEKWGQTLRRYYGTSNTSPQSSPFLDKFGYWTGPGCFYYNNTGNDTYEDVLLDVDRNTRYGSMKLGFIELDNWWYQSGSTPEAVVTWETNNQSLPHGLSFLVQNVTTRSFVLSCGWWSSNTTYAKQNNGSYAFIVEGEFALPIEKRFWVDLFYNVSYLNVSHVYMDSMAVQYYGVTALRTQAGMAEDWLKNITSAANETGMTLTFSGALPRMLMAAAQYPAVVQALVTAPYMDKNVTDQWKIGVTSALAGALGLAAFKGSFWSYNVPDENYHGRNESFPALQMAIATLSMGSVAAGDETTSLGSSPTPRIVRGDWLVLRPSKMATAIDAQIIYAAKNSSGNFGQIWTTVSIVPVLNETVNLTSSYTMGIILAAEVPSAFNVTPSMLFPGVYAEQWPEDLYVWNYADPEHNGPVFQPFSEQSPLTLNDKCWADDSQCLYYVSPAILQVPQDGGYTSVHLLGEDKFVPLSPLRVRYINVTHGGVTLNLEGHAGEYVSVAYRVNHEMRSVGGEVSDDGTIVLALNVTSPVTPPPLTTEETTKETTTKAVESTTTADHSGAASVVEYHSMVGRLGVALSVIVMRCFAHI